MVNSILLLWALVGLIGRVHGKCSLAPIADNERSIAYACIHGDLSDLNELSSETEWIEFSVSRFREIPDDAFHRFRNLRRLSFYNCHVNVIGPEAFRGLHRLDWLIFHGTRVHAARAAWFRHLPNLRKLILDRCGLVHVEPDVFRMLPRVETLGLRDNDLDCLPVEELSHMRMLRAVRIDGNPWWCECRMRLDRFFRERSIVQEERCKPPPGVHQRLQCMTQIDIPILFPIITVEQIGGYEESRYSNHFQTSALTSLDRLPDRSTWIEITGLRIDRVPAYAFFRFGNSLRVLELRDCSIDVIEPGAFAGLHQLQRLVLVGNRLPAVAAHWFSDLVALQQLVLARNAIERLEPGALRPLSDSLRHLDMRYNRLQCLSPDELTHLRRLERLDAVGNPWNCECRRNLQRMLMERHIGFEISGGRCYENGKEVGEPTTGDDRGQHWQVEHTTTTGIGQVRWTSFEETLLERNITVTRPSTVAPTIQVSTERPQPPSKGTCVLDKTEWSRQVYTCSGINSLQELEIIPRSAHTVRIILSNLKTIPTRAFARFDGYMSRLELRNCGIEKIEYRAFADLYNLQYLSLHSNQLESMTSEVLEGLTNLRQLDVSRNHIYRITNDAFDMLPQLRGLDVSDNYMNCIGVEYMARKMPHLLSLRVSGNPWSCLCGTKLASFLDSRGIRYDRESLLSMNDDCYATGLPVTPTTILTTSKSTTTEPPSVPLHQEPITGSCTVQQDSTGLRYRCIGGNLSLLKSIPRDVVAIEFHEGNLPRLPVGSLYNFPRLQELVIRNCGLRTIEAGAFRGLDSLERLTIQQNPLTSIEQGWFNIERLERLDLRGNSIRYIAPGAFRQLPRLVYLNLEGNDLQCIFTSDLSDMSDLHVVEFAGNPLKWRCRMDLEQFLEMRKIKFVKVENSCEGKKIMRSLLYQNRSSEPLECPPGCSTANEIEQAKCLTFFVAFAMLVAMRIH
ncbi:slit homolog 1 protein [Harpegnathos saltator]|uniref:Slit-like protein 1 protein n=1 Tax=Harpegnathos saltator TaxID=610380 RepID=E2BDQ4_HARSA|nr:slit homolog 1 protein [Harpegnathos saltator]XP_011136892.1 slit homolog 1 protein [Harpegnathos saltator]XP_025162570.1 slit homolog 1 protein [Harpegnathos saltator]XP_025162571.1 slit homolog 1 protein [Harpegnathos saltator]EFN86216.1 Slit-like protein 1 protein [Harpegnathos saltator]